MLEIYLESYYDDSILLKTFLDIIKLQIVKFNYFINIVTQMIISHRRSVAVLFIRSGVTQCTFLMVLYLDLMHQCGLHVVLWSHISTLMLHLAAEPCSTAGLLFPYRCPSGTILLTQYSMAWDWWVSRAGPMLLY